MNKISLRIPITNLEILLFQILIQRGFRSLADILVLQRLLEGGLILVRERGLVNCAAELSHFGYYLVAGSFHDQDKVC